MLHVAPGDPRVRAVDALDEFVAEIVRCAHRRRIVIPPALFDWAVGEGTWAVERFTAHCLPADEPAPPCPDAVLRCAVRRWVAPFIAARFESLKEVCPELQQRTGCSAARCAHRLCEP